MSAVLEPQFQCVPYFKERDNFPPDVLRLIYRKLVVQGVDKELLHNADGDEEEFVRFAGSEALTSIFIDMNGKYAGIAWLSDVEETATLRKGLGAFAFFKEYWHPDISKVFGDICLGHWFNVLEFDLVYGITPAVNRPARRYCQRLGFQYSARIPGFVSYKGKTVDAMVATMTRQQFNAKA